MRAPLQVRLLNDQCAAPWASITLVPESPSTNADLVAAADAGRMPLWSVLVAEHQSAGRGRLGRTWTTIPGAALTFSALVPAPADLGWVPLIAGLAVAETIGQWYAVRPGLKWPNDLLAPDGTDSAGAQMRDRTFQLEGSVTHLGGRKLGGILCEVTGGIGPGTGTGRQRGVVIGIGLNVDQSDVELPVPTATSLRQLSGSHPDQLTRDALLVAILNRLATRLEDWARDPQSVRAAYRSACVTLGRQVRVDLGAAGVTTATAVRIDDDGRLVVAENGVERALAAGDVTHVRMP